MAWGEAWVETGYVFTRENGEPWHPDTITKMFVRRARADGLPHLSPHRMRHSSATVALEEKVPLKVVSERLGHASINITADIYQHVSEGMDREAAERIAGRIFGKRQH